MMSTPKKESLRHNTALNKEILAMILANLWRNHVTDHDHKNPV